MTASPSGYYSYLTFWRGWEVMICCNMCNGVLQLNTLWSDWWTLLQYACGDSWRGSYPSVLPESLAPDVKLEIKGVGWMRVVVEELVESQQRAGKHLCMAMKTDLCVRDLMHRCSSGLRHRIIWIEDTEQYELAAEESHHSIKIWVHCEIFQITQGQAPTLITGECCPWPWQQLCGLKQSHSASLPLLICERKTILSNANSLKKSDPAWKNN